MKKPKLFCPETCTDAYALESRASDLLWEAGLERAAQKLCDEVAELGKNPAFNDVLSIVKKYCLIRTEPDLSSRDEE